MRAASAVSCVSRNFATAAGSHTTSDRNAQDMALTASDADSTGLFCNGQRNCPKRLRSSARIPEQLHNGGHKAFRIGGL